MKKHLILICLIVAFHTTTQAQKIKQAELTRILSLDGSWDVTGYSPNKDKQVTLKGTVPGHIHPDLQRAGLIPDPFWRDQAEQCQWPETWEWRYKRVFELPDNFDQKCLSLQFDGLDTYTTIILNGKNVGITDDMFIPYEFNISGWLRPGKNVIEVRIAPPIQSISNKPYQQYGDAAFDPTGARPYIRRMQCTFGWDWVNRFVSSGIWKSCRIVSYPNARISDLFVYTQQIVNNTAKLKLQATTTIKNNVGKQLQISIADPDGKEVWNKKILSPAPVISLEAELTNAKLWWPNGFGEHPLYQVTAILLDENGRVLHRSATEMGIRTVSIEELPEKGKPGKTFTIVVNGKRIFAKGGNWVPADPFPSRVTPQKYDRLIGQARDAGLNIMRSWGGGIYEPQAFWHACNTMGIMVTQDLLLACARYPEEDPQFTTLLKKEFTSAIRMLRNNPSLILWAGDNELGLGKRSEDNWSFKKFHQNVTAPLVKEMDPSRVFRLTSPLGGNTNNSPTEGDSHVSIQNSLKDGDMRNYRKVIDSICAARLMSENAISGAPPRRTLLKFMTEDDIAGSEMWEYHTKDNPYVKGSLTLFRIIERESGLLYGDPQANINKKISNLEYLQYDFARLSMESSRRRKFSSSGVQFWMFNDCWPASGWSMLDYWGGRKAGWYGMAAGSRPVIAAPEITTDSIKWWISSDLLQPVSVKVEIKAQPMAGKCRWTKNINLTIPANSSITAIAFSLKEIRKELGKDAALVCDIKYEKGFDRSWWFDGLPKEMPLQKANLQFVQTSHGDHGEITIQADNWARVVTLDADVDFDDNYFELLPGEKRTIKWQSNVKPFKDDILVSCWNE